MKRRSLGQGRLDHPSFCGDPAFAGRTIDGSLLRVIGGSSEMGFGYLVNDDGLCVAL